MATVKVIQRQGRKNLVLRWTDDVTGFVSERSSGTTNRREAERIAGKLEADLRAGREQSNGHLAWAEFRARFEDEHLPSLAVATQRSYITALNSLEKHIRPKSLGVITAATISQFQARLRKTGVAESTVANHLRHIKAALRWARTMELIADVPELKHHRLKAGGFERFVSYGLKSFAHEGVT